MLDAEHVRLRARPRRLRAAAPCVRPVGTCNPGKIVPTPRLCGEVPGPVPARPREDRRCRASLARGRIAAPETLGPRRAKAARRARRRRAPRLHGLNRILEHDPGDLTVHGRGGRSPVRARESARGARAAALARPSGDPTIGTAARGGTTSARAAPLRRPRDLVLGATLVLADGTVANAGGKVVKNVAGYDLATPPLRLGGAPRLIARASLRLHPAAGAPNARRRGRTTYRRSSRTLPRLAAPAERARRSSSRSRRRPLRGIRAAQSRRSSRGRAGRRTRGRASVWDEVASSPAAASKAAAHFAPGELAGAGRGLRRSSRFRSGVAYAPAQSVASAGGAARGSCRTRPSGVLTWSAVDPATGEG